MAERGGFEPPVRLRYTRFPGVRFKPLSHLSTCNYSDGVDVSLQHFSYFSVMNSFFAAASIDLGRFDDDTDRKLPMRNWKNLRRTPENVTLEV